MNNHFVVNGIKMIGNESFALLNIELFLLLLTNPYIVKVFFFSVTKQTETMSTAHMLTRLQLS